MSKLKENLQAIAAEKEKIKSGDFVKGDSIFGITGELEDCRNSVEETDENINNGSRLVYVSTTNPKVRQNWNKSKIILSGLMNKITKTENNESINIEKCAIDKTAIISSEIPQTELANVIELTAEKLVKGNAVLGIEGTGETNIPFEEEPEYDECLEIANSILGIVDAPNIPGESEGDNPSGSHPTP